MHTYRLVDDFVDAEAEQALLASLTRIPTLYWDLLDLITPEIFLTQADAWQALALAWKPVSVPLYQQTGPPHPTLTPPRAASWTCTSAVCWRRRKSGWRRRSSMKPRPRRTSSPCWKKRLSASRRRCVTRPQAGCSGAAPCCPRSLR